MNGMSPTTKTSGAARRTASQCTMHWSIVTGTVPG